MYYLNVFNLAPEINEEDVSKYFAKVGAKAVHRASKEAMDVEFESKEDLIKAIDLGAGSISNRPYFIRTSYHAQRSVPFRGRGGGRGRERGDRDRGDRGDRRR